MTYLNTEGWTPEQKWLDPLFAISYFNICYAHEGCCITFLPLNSVQDLSKKERFKELFDIAYFSNRLV